MLSWEFVGSQPVTFILMTCKDVEFLTAMSIKVTVFWNVAAV
jgi:hypothetical protein